MVAAGWPVQSLLALAPAGMVPVHDFVTVLPAVDGTVTVVPVAAAAPAPGAASRAGRAQSPTTPMTAIVRTGRRGRRYRPDIRAPSAGVWEEFVIKCRIPVPPAAQVARREDGG